MKINRNSWYNFEVYLRLKNSWMCLWASVMCDTLCCVMWVNSHMSWYWSCYSLQHTEKNKLLIVIGSKYQSECDSMCVFAYLCVCVNVCVLVYLRASESLWLWVGDSFFMCSSLVIHLQFIRAVRTGGVDFTSLRGRTCCRDIFRRAVVPNVPRHTRRPLFSAPRRVFTATLLLFEVICRMAALHAAPV